MFVDDAVSFPRSARKRRHAVISSSCEKSSRWKKTWRVIWNG